MEQTAQSQPNNPVSGGLLGKLLGKKEKIEDSLPWKELDAEAKVDRLRDFAKNSLADLQNRHKKEIQILTKKIVDLESHTHNEHGQPIIQKRLGTENSIYEEKIKYEESMQLSPNLVNDWI